MAGLKQLLFMPGTPLAPRPKRIFVFIVYGCAGAASVVLVGIATVSLRSVVCWTLLLAAALRSYSLFRSVGWIWKRGDEFSETYESLPVPVRDRIELKNDDDADLLSLYRATGGAFFPFGVRAIVLKQAARQTGKRSYRAVLNWSYRLWKFYFFTVAWFLTTAVVVEVGNKELPAFARVVGFIGAELVLLGCLSIAMEAGLSYIKFRSWSLAYHQFKVQPTRDISELSTFVGGVFSLVLSAAAATLYVSKQVGGFNAIGHAYGVWPQIGLSIYYTITTLSGNGDAGPNSVAAYVVTASEYVTSVAFLVIVVSLLFDALGKPTNTTPGTP